MSEIIPGGRPDRAPSDTAESSPVSSADAEAYAAEAKALAEKHHVKVPPDTVVVQPGNRSYKTINAALASITDASASNQYMVYAGPGTYRERVQMKPFVILSGTLDGNNDALSTITAPADPKSWGTVRMASNSTLSNFNVSCTVASGSKEIYPCAVWVSGASPFSISNCDLLAEDSGQETISVVPLAVVDGSSGWTQYTDLYATSTWGGLVYPAAVALWGRSRLTMMGAELIAKSKELSAGGATYEGSNLELQSCKVTGQSFSLVIWFHDASITARKCVLNGPVGPGVKVIN